METLLSIFTIEHIQQGLDILVDITAIGGVLFACNRFKIRWRAEIYRNDANRTLEVFFYSLDAQNSTWLSCLVSYPRKWGLYTFVDGVMGANPKRPKDIQYQFISFFKSLVQKKVSKMKDEYRKQGYTIV